MTDSIVPPDLQAKLRAQAEALAFDFSDGSIPHAALYDALATAYRAGQSTERARQQGLIAKWREYADRKRLKANLVVGAMYESGQADTLFACADELESA